MAVIDLGHYFDTAAGVRTKVLCAEYGRRQKRFWLVILRFSPRKFFYHFSLREKVNESDNILNIFNAYTQ